MTDLTESSHRRFSSRDALMLGGGVLVALVALAVWTMWTRGSATPTDSEEPTSSTSQVASPDELKVSREILAGADDLDALRRTADQIARVVGRVAGASDVKVEQVAGLPQLQITPNRTAIARYGLNVEDVNAVVQSIVVGQEAGSIYQGEQRFGLVVRFAEETGRSVEAIKNLLVVAPNGARVPVSQVADVSVVEGPAQISREDTRRRIAVELNVRGRDIASFVADAQQQIGAQVPLPPGYYITWGGQFENLQRGYAQISASVGTFLFAIILPMRDTFIRCL